MMPPGQKTCLHGNLMRSANKPKKRLFGFRFDSSRSVSLSVVAFLALASSISAASETTLRSVVDRHVSGAFQGRNIAPAERSSDAEFLRRVWLDLTGTIPTAVAAQEFIDDTTPDKRERVVDQLLASPESARHLARVFDVYLMERRADKHVPSPQWREYLRSSFASNKPWDQLVREILSSDGADAALRPAAKFLLDRDAEPNLVTRDVSRLFLGMNLQCAQCHDHPLVTDYEQDHYYGLFAFFNRSFVFTDKKKVVTLAEKAEGDVTYKSVFEKDASPRGTGPRLLVGSMVEEPKFEKGHEYEVAPADGVRPVPKFSRRQQLAPRLATAESIEFRKNLANRLWALVMGRGLVEPLDMHHSENPPSHPELLAILADEIGARKFDMRSFLRELLLSDTYQRSSALPAGVESFEPDSFASALLKPLSPEQLAWSVMQATGLADAERRGLGDKLNEQTLHDRLVGNVAPFVRTFGGLPGQAEEQFQATMDQALFLSNGEAIRNWLAPRSGNLVDRLLPLKEPAAIAEQLFLSILTRRPSEVEQVEVAEYLKGRDADRSQALQELAWALIASVEFRFNH